MSAADDREQERYLQQCIDTMWGNHALRDMLTDGFERIVGRAPSTSVRFPVPQPLPVVAAPDPPLATIVESTVTITLPDYGSAVREPTLDEIKAIRGKLDEWHNGLLDELLCGPIHNGVAHPGPTRTPPWPAASSFFDKMGTVSSGTTLRHDDFVRAYQTLWQPDPYGMSGAGFAINAMDPYGPQPMPPGQGTLSAGDSIISECRGRGCREIREEFDIARLQTVYTHVGPQGERTTIGVSDRMRFTRNETEAFLREWLRSIHGEAPMPNTLERERAPLCNLCGQERDPDVEPVELEIAAWTSPSGARTVEACSPHCATAYAMRLDMAREHPGPRTQRQRDQLAARHDLADNTVALRGHAGITESTPMLSKRLHNPWSDEDVA